MRRKTTWWMDKRDLLSDVKVLRQISSEWCCWWVDWHRRTQRSFESRGLQEQYVWSWFTLGLANSHWEEGWRIDDMLVFLDLFEQIASWWSCWKKRHDSILGGDRGVEIHGLNMLMIEMTGGGSCSKSLMMISWCNKWCDQWCLDGASKWLVKVTWKINWSSDGN